MRSPASTAALFVAIELAFAVSGAVLVRRRVAPAIGWLFLAYALVDGVNRVGEYWSAAAVVARPGVLPAGYGMAWLDGTTEHAVLVLLAAVVLLFPTGRPPSAAWRWPLWALACGTVVAGLARALQPGDLEGVPFFADNPIGWSAADDPLDVVQALGAAVLLAGVAGCLLSLAVRWLSGSDVERRQLEGLALVALVVAVVVPVVPLLPDPFTVLYAVAMIVFPVVLTLAVLELHLDTTRPGPARHRGHLRRGCRTGGGLPRDRRRSRRAARTGRRPVAGGRRRGRRRRARCSPFVEQLNVSPSG